MGSGSGNAHVRRRVVAVALVAAMLAGCGSKGTGTAGASPSKIVPVFTAVQLSDGVLFNDGPAASYLVQLNRPATKWTDQLRVTQRGIHAALDADPAAATAIARGLQSGDPVKVETAFTSLAKIANSVLDNQFGQAQVNAAVGVIDRGLSDNQLISATVNGAQLDNYTGDSVTVDTDVAAYLEFVVAVAVVAVAVLVFEQPRTDQGTLIEDTLVKDFTVDLRAGAAVSY